MKRIIMFGIILMVISAGMWWWYSCRAPLCDVSSAPFGYQFSPHMFVMDWDETHGWHNQRITSYGSMPCDPACLALHYGQTIFEGMKAFAHADGSVVLFRPYNHLRRMNDSARRLCMPEIEVETVLAWMKKTIARDRNYIPTAQGTSLYIRPTMIATETTINLKPSSRYTFFVIFSPVGPLYTKDLQPVSVLVSDAFTRSSVGGVGAVKTGGNYAASMLAQQQAKEKHCAQVLWLDPVERKYVEEVGSMNIFFVMNGVVVTPALTGTILPGITRKSILELGASGGLPMVERRVSIDEVINGIQNGTVTEIFGTGTAAGVVSIGQLQYGDKVYTIDTDKAGPITTRFYETLRAIQYGTQPDDLHWLEFVS